MNNPQPTSQIAPSSSPAAPPSARLVQLLAALGHAAGSEPHASFTERLGRLFGLGDTMELDAALAFRAKGQFQPSSDLASKLQHTLSSTRDKLVQRLQLCFNTTASDTTPGLPVLEPGQKPDTGNQAAPDVAPYLNFYLARQRELAAATRQLRTKVRNAVATTSPAMAHLAQLDTVFDHTLAGYSSQSFATLPALVEKRFHTLWQGRQQMNFDQQDQAPAQSPEQDWTKPGGWLHQYCQEMQMLLLAELEVRLEPAMALLDAFTHEVSHTP